MSKSRFREVITVAPALGISLLYWLFLGHRHDYLGHFAAGYGASLCAMLVWLKSLRAEQFERLAKWSALPACLVCILLGTITEATIFRIARFDEIDFCNQSLGAVLAAVVMLAFTSSERPANSEFDAGTILSIFLLSLGGWFAFT
jgi:hypothetical protein